MTIPIQQQPKSVKKLIVYSNNADFIRNKTASGGMNLFYAAARIAVLIVAAFLAIGARGSEKPDSSEIPKMEFSKRPLESTNTLSIGQPEIRINTNLVEQLMGSDITNIICSSVGDLLNNSARFILTRADQPDCTCQATVTEFEIKQFGNTNKANTSPLSRIGGWFHSSAGSLTTNANWENSNQKMSIHCHVSLEIWHAESKNLLGAGEGEINLTNSGKALSMELPGLTTTSGQSGGTNHIGLEARVVKLASYCALTNLLPSLDKNLQDPTRLAAKVKVNSKGADLEKVAGSKFCTQCGEPLKSGNKFCGHCGAKSTEGN